ncbi:hypothetical protein [Nocardia flavorosea]|uniref:Uncharacterized protein n=1 Tax=Nocardia flavorosea TaxID=53429 RepID=A0A846YNS8_9NOCA|nr:hypothetical protein [Nocardia flavorosea]NKY60777.1 hypothetical protein [Nocardia flavorosea]
MRDDQTLRDGAAEFVQQAVAAEKARVEHIRRQLLQTDSCASCGVVVGDQVRHVEWHEEQQKWRRAVFKTFEQFAKPRRTE